MSSSSMVPYRLAQVAALFMSFAWGVIGFAFGINAVVKSDHDKSRIKSLIPSGATVSIDTNDILGAGGALTAACAVLFVLSLIFLVPLLLSYLGGRPTNRGIGGLRAGGGRLWRSLQAHSMLFTTLFIFATVIPTTDFVATRQAKITATLGGIVLQPGVIQLIESELGVTGIYRKIGYLRDSTILSWIAFLFSAIATAISYIALRSTPTAVKSSGASLGSDDGTVRQEQVVKNEKEKEGAVTSSV